MSGGGHPHPGQRTKWFSMLNRPAIQGEYECKRWPRDIGIRSWDGRRWRNPASKLPILLEVYLGWRGLREPAR